MTVSTIRYGKIITHIGTIGEVVAAINLNNVDPEQVWIFPNGTNITGIVY